MITSMILVELSYQPGGRRQQTLLGRVPVKGDFIQLLHSQPNDPPLVVENVLLLEVNEDLIMRAPIPVAIIQVRTQSNGPRQG